MIRIEDHRHTVGLRCLIRVNGSRDAAQHGPKLVVTLHTLANKKLCSPV